ncbi:helix-turn-helix domain-containing protein [Actinoplanes sp. NPDC051859]|uniref:helix-turn-helix domain-containing protein n=1 Tax=Actinoplanes sp. NPDC051859 TaxID=3363909 RepID=UPI0037A9DD43
MITVNEWTGLHTRALRHAMRMSVRVFAAHLGVAVRTVSKWESHGAAIRPRPDMQAVLDTALSRGDAGVRLRFESVLAAPPSGAHTRRMVTLDYEAWADDHERAASALSAQNFTFAAHLLDRWITQVDAHQLDDKGLHLYARSTALRGDVLRDQGATSGPLSAGTAYGTARDIFHQLGSPRRVAQLDLSLAVIDEMSGCLVAAAHQYQQLADDDRLSARDRSRALLWVGTALDKHGDHDYATAVMIRASRAFDTLTEPEDWAVAQQKLALSHRGAGKLTAALDYIGRARASAAADSPLQRARLATAHGHILISDPASRIEGLAMLDQATNLAATYGMSHQLRSIEGIRHQAQHRPPDGDQGEHA